MSDTYTKLFSSITESTIVSEPVATRWLWVTMLAMADAGGCVYGSVPGLARRANITLAETEAALATFYAPDSYSRTKEHEGRRIEDIDGGWRLLNHGKYREMGSRPNNYGELMAADGYVYYAGAEGKVKVGFSKNPWARIATLKTAIPAIELLGIERGGMALEKQRHQEFEASRGDGEWFALTDDLADHIRGLEKAPGLKTVRGANRKVATKLATTVAKVATTYPYPDKTPVKQERKERACVEPSDEGASQQASGESPAAILLTLNTGVEFAITEAQVCEFASLYPAVNVMQQLRAMRGWCMANPNRRKTRAGILRFVNKWLAKAQDEPKEQHSANRFAGRKLSAVEQVEQAIADRKRDEGFVLDGQAVRIAAR